MSKPLCIAIIDADLAIHVLSDTHAVESAERSHSLRIGLLESGWHSCNQT
jgi:hypothetical protein